MTVRPEIDSELQQVVKVMFDRIPDIIVAGMLVGTISGAALEVLRERWLLRLRLRYRPDRRAQAFSASIASASRV